MAKKESRESRKNSLRRAHQARAGKAPGKSTGGKDSGVNWGAALAIAGVAGLGAYFLFGRTSSAAAPTGNQLRANLQRAALTPTTAATRATAAARPRTATSSAPATRRGLPQSGNQSVMSIQIALNSIDSATSCGGLVPDGGWGVHTEEALGCLIGAAAIAQGEPIDGGKAAGYLSEVQDLIMRLPESIPTLAAWVETKVALVRQWIAAGHSYA